MKHAMAYAATLSLSIIFSSAVSAETIYTLVKSETRTEPYLEGELLVTASIIKVVDKDASSGATRDLGNFTLHRVITRTMYNSPGLLLGTTILMPGGGSNFNSYELDETDAYEKSLAATLAKAGFDVFGYSPRTYGLAAGYCNDPKNDCAVMSEWGMAAIVSDINGYVLPTINAIHADELAADSETLKPTIGGWSLGAISTLAVVNDLPSGYKGLWLYEGLGYSENADVNAVNNNPDATYSCPTLENKLAAGQYYDDQVFALLKDLNQRAMSDPTGDSPYSEQLNNSQMYYLAVTLPSDTYVPNYQLLSGGMQRGFTYASDERVNRMFGRLNAYEPVRLMRDYVCAFAGKEKSFSEHLGEFEGGVFVTRGRKAFGSYMPENLDTLGLDIRKQVTWNQKGYGESAHADAYMRLDHAKYFDTPLLDWLRAQ